MRVLSHWLKVSGLRGDAVMARLFKNAGILLSGSAVQSILALIASALMARALGVEVFGIFVTIQTYIIVVDKLVNFQSWQALIKYGSDALASDNSSTLLKQLFKFGTVLDASSALLGTVVAFMGVLLVAGWQNWDDQVMRYAMLSSIVVLFNLSGTPTAILRLFDRFDAIALTGITTAFARVVMYGAAFVAGAGLATFVTLWIISTFIQYGVLLYFGWRELYRQDLWRGMLGSSLRRTRQTFPGIISFVLTTNVNTSIRMTSREVDILVVGSVLGPQAVGLYRIVKQFASVLSKIAEPISQVIYPELAKLWSTGKVDRFQRYIGIVLVFVGTGSLCGWLIFVLFGESIIYLTYGDDFVAAYPVLTWYMLAIVIIITGIPLQPSLLSMGHVNLVFWINVASTVAYFALLFLLLSAHGILGISLSYLGYALTWFSIMAGFNAARISRQKKKAINMV